MLTFHNIQGRVVRHKILSRKYKMCKLILFVNFIILGSTFRDIFMNTPKISLVVATNPPLNDSTLEDFRIKENQEFLINTPGCYIPNYAKTFKYERSVKKITNINNMCGLRYIFIDIIKDDKINFRMHKFTENSITCCYRYISESTMPGHGFDELSYSPCEVFTNNSKAWLMQEVITVICKNKLHKTIVYQDTYIMLKKINENNQQSETENKMQWNVLMIGLAGMSRTRAFDTMPRTTKYLKEHKWLDFKAYQKVENNTFQNLMAVLTGKRMSIYSNCTSDVNKCADYFIWNKYKDAGYKTAYGESNLQSESFGSGFKRRPTDHYMRPSIFSKTSYSGEILCTGSKPSATHLLEYAHKFVDSYKTNGFFGIFWINQFASYNLPERADADFVSFFKNLNSSGVLNNTFVIFFSDQGPSFGKMRLKMESHYDNQLPMLFVWLPVQFRQHNKKKYHNLKVNQKRLITPYDVYITLADILKLSINSSEKVQSEGCSKCTSLLDKLSPNRTCADAGAGEDWCSCHNMSTIDTHIERVNNSISLVKEHLQKIRSSIKTIPCTSCEQFSEFTIIRAHEYHQNEKTYYVIAFHTSNSLRFESVVEQYSARFSRVLSLSVITRSNDMGTCTLHRQDRPFCVCAFDNNCVSNPINKEVVNLSFLKVNKNFNAVIKSLMENYF